MDPNTALSALRLDPAAHLDAHTVEAAYAREAAARHPSRYPDEPGRLAAEAWALTLAEARSALLRSIGSTDAAAWVPPVGQPDAASGPFAATGPAASATRALTPAADAAQPGPNATAAPRRRRRGLVIGIIAASMGVLALFVAAGFGATRLAEQFTEQASAFEDSTEDGALPDVERYSVAETSFTFPAALELYNDWRYDDRCPAEFTFGCWQGAVITESSCGSLQIDLEFSNDGEDWITQARETISVSEVTAGEITPVVYGHDGYDYGWIADVRCTDEAVTVEPATNARAVSIPLSRLEARQWASEDTGFWFPASLEFTDDGRLGPCPAESERGCWQAVLVPEGSCDRLTVQYSFTNATTSQLRQAITRTDVVPGEPIDVVFGNDAYDFGWISMVSCVS